MLAQLFFSIFRHYKQTNILNMIHAIVGAIAAGCVVGGFAIGLVLIFGSTTKRRGR